MVFIPRGIRAETTKLSHLYAANSIRFVDRLMSDHQISAISAKKALTINDELLIKMYKQLIYRLISCTLFFKSE